MKLVQVSEPAVLPIRLDECKRDLRITDDYHDAYLVELIGEAVNYVDGPFGVLNRALVSQQWQIVLPCFPTCLEVPLSPVISIDSIAYYDTDNASQTYATSNYILTGDNDSAEITVTDSATLPGVYDRPDAVSITFTAGYGTTADSVPAGIRRMLRVLVSHWFENPVAASPENMQAMPFSFESIKAQYQRGVVG